MKIESTPYVTSYANGVDHTEDDDGEPVDYWVRVHGGGVRIVFAELQTLEQIRSFQDDLADALALYASRPDNIIPFIESK